MSRRGSSTRPGIVKLLWIHLIEVKLLSSSSTVESGSESSSSRERSAQSCDYVVEDLGQLYPIAVELELELR